MADFLDTQGVSYYLKKLIDNSDDKLYLISPYLQLNKSLKQSVIDRHKLSIDIIIIYGKEEDKINYEDKEWIKSLPGIKLKFLKDLHAKCYFNEKEAIITSMNLHMYSQQNNVEMGIYVSKEKDEEVYKQIAKEVDRIKRGSEQIVSTLQKNDIKRSSTNEKTTTNEYKKGYNKSTGYCIRTGIGVPFDIGKPLSLDAYKKWNEFGNPDYPEKYCHFSGESSNGETSVNNPILKKNWKKAKEVYHL